MRMSFFKATECPPNGTLDGCHHPKQTSKFFNNMDCEDQKFGLVLIAKAGG